MLQTSQQSFISSWQMLLGNCNCEYTKQDIWNKSNSNFKWCLNLNSIMDAGRITNPYKMNQLLNMYSAMQIIERIYNDNYQRLFWPSFMQAGIICFCISSALCLSKWKKFSSDPRLPILIIVIINAGMMCTFYPYCASKVNTASCLFLNFKCRVFNKVCIRKRILSKQALSIKVSDNFIDSEFPLSVSKFCVNNIFSLIVIFRASN